MKGLIVLILVGIGLYSCNTSEWFAESQRKQAEQDRREETPHIIREADGCKVYAFRVDSRYAYFTRCGDKTSTTSSYTVNCGKNCTRVESNTIENKP